MTMDVAITREQALLLVEIGRMAAQVVGVSFDPMTPNNTEAEPAEGSAADTWKAAYDGMYQQMTEALSDANDRAAAAEAERDALRNILQDFVREYDGFEDGDGEPCSILLAARAALPQSTEQTDGE